jgi:hypothetical protein
LRQLLIFFSNCFFLISWDSICDADDPEAKLGETKFYKTINLMKNLDVDLTESLPSIQDILSHEELEEHVQNKTFIYLLRACYELLTI